MRSLVAAVVFAAVTAASLLVPARAAQAQELTSTDGGPLAIETCAVRATVEEGIALVDIDQTFRNDATTQREGVWSIRLPESSVVHSLSMWMGGKEKTGRVLEAQYARRVYDQIVRGNRDPALLEEVGFRRFRVSVFPIPPRDTVRVRLRYAFVVPDDLGVHALEIPLPKRAAAVDVQADIQSAGGLALCNAPGSPDARVEMREGGATLRWSRERADNLRPMTVSFAPRRAGFGVSLLTHREAGAAEGWFVARVVPHLDSVPDLPRDVVFVVDRSGSMQGVKMDQARAALLHGLATLRKGDRFDVVSFSTDVRMLGDRLLAADETNLGRARAEARALDASGGTNIGDALTRALALREPAAGRLFVVVFLTDGDATVGETNPDVIVRDWRARSADAGVRLFALGVGEEVKDFLLSRLALGSRGAAEYVRRGDDLQAKLTGLYERVRTPLLTEPEIEVRGVPVSFIEPRPLPDVFRGGAVVLAGRFVEGGKAELVLRGRQGLHPVEVRVPVEFPTQPVARPHVAQLWARARIDRLLEDLRSNPSAIGELRGEIVALGLRHQVVSPYTSFLVVEDGVHIPDDREIARVPVEPADTRSASGPPSPDGGGGPSTPGEEDDGGGGGESGGGELSSGGGGSPPPGGGGGGGGPTTGAGVNAFGARGKGGTILTATDARLQVEVVPVLRALLARDARGEDVDTQTAAAIALARIRDPEAMPRLIELAANAKRGFEPRLVAAATLALGASGKSSPDVREFLAAVLSDRTRDEPNVRPFAAISLGMIGRRADADGAARKALLDVLTREETSPELHSGVVLAIGLYGDPSLAEVLAEMVRSRRSPFGQRPLSDREHAHAAAALARLQSGTTLAPGRASARLRGPLLRILEDRTQSPADLRAAAEDLIRLRDDRAITPLLAIVADPGDMPARNRALAVHVLGRMGDSRREGWLPRLRVPVDPQDAMAFETALLDLL